jgi:hypothetical protein
VLTALRSSKQEIQMVVALIDRWRALGAELAQALVRDAPPADADVRRWVAAIGRLQVGPFMRLASAIWQSAAAHGMPAPPLPAVWQVYRRMQRSAFRDTIDLGALAVDGDDLRRAGIPPGPALGKILQALLAAVIDDPTRNAADWLLQEAQRLQRAAMAGNADGSGA